MKNSEELNIDYAETDREFDSVLIVEPEVRQSGNYIPVKHVVHFLGRNIDEEAFEQVYKTYFRKLSSYALVILKDRDEAEEVVQQVFFKLWVKCRRETFSGSVPAYLYRAVYNESLNYLKHQKVRARYQQQFSHSNQYLTVVEQDRTSISELEGKLRDSLNELPQQCRKVFQLSRFDELKYREIAEKLDISVKTVERHVCKALKILRTKMVEFLQ